MAEFSAEAYGFGFGVDTTNNAALNDADNLAAIEQAKILAEANMSASEYAAAQKTQQIIIIAGIVGGVLILGLLIWILKK